MFADLKSKIGMITVGSTLLLGCLVADVKAVSLSVVNGGFEDFVLENGHFSRPFGNPATNPLLVLSSDPIPGWTLSNPLGDAGTYNPTTVEYSAEAPDPFNVAYTKGTTLSQLLSATLQPNTTYDLSVLVGARNNAPSLGYSVQLLAGSTLLAEDIGGPAAAGEFFNVNVIYVVGDNDPAVGEPLMIRLGAPNSTTTYQTNFDLVGLDMQPEINAERSAVPEPATACLSALALGGLAVNLLRRRRV